MEDGFVPVEPALALTDGIVVTGSRDIGREAAGAAFAEHLAGWCGRQRTWLAGGAIGIDRWALEWLHARGETVWVVVPFTVSRQPASVQETLRRAARIIELKLPDGRQAYIQRNYYMVEHATVVVGFWSGKKGGTLATLKYGEKRGREVHWHALHGGTA